MKSWIIGLAALLIMLGTASALALDRANFYQDQVRSELTAQKISFGPAEEMSPEELALPGVAEYAGQQVTTGDMARVYASYIGLHMSESAVELGLEADSTYATIPSRAKATEAREAKANGADAATVAALEEEAAALADLRDSFFRGTTLRGNLLSAYYGDLAASDMMFVGYALASAAAIAGIAFAVSIAYAFRRRTSESTDQTPEFTPVYAPAPGGD